MKQEKQNIYEELGFDEETAANLKMRAEMMIRLRGWIRENGLTQQDAAKKLGIAQADVSAINTLKVDKFTIDKLVNLLTKIGYSLDIDANRRRSVFSVIDRTRDKGKNVVFLPGGDNSKQA